MAKINSQTDDHSLFVCLAGADPVFEKVIVLENVSPRGYFICSNKINIGMDYVLAGLQTIARFHGLTYAIKEEMPEKFYQIVKNIKLVRYDKDNVYMPHIETVNSRILRVVKGLKARNEDLKFTKQIEDLFKDAYHKVLIRCVEPVEPLATIVHGDCTQNNVMFRKVDPGGFQAILIDFQLMMYTSPAADVSVWIYMCLSLEDIMAHRETLFNAYHDTLKKILKERNIWSPEKYSREAFWQDYKQHAIIGYITAAYFLPIMTEFANNNDLLQLDDEAIEKANASGGGEVLTNALVDMLLDARDAGLLDFYLNSDKAEVCLRK
ncbi:hypothetical protein TSAR_008676 [Trichomalopsis sarcophagae]|uniref:CHK kinase-like domain-containing protein n=1 Tax=Trichomalopsis sarcophagae TaxID=543379 RepID=A0A232EQW6_9HYME|nr:hypothetical protein TSAR_008676 [Trichomalopsis sarcophagae]